MTTRTFLGGTLAAVALACTAQADDQHQIESVTLSDIRGMVFCEFLLISDTEVTIYNTSANGECDLDAFGKLDPTEIAREHGVKAAQLNGPKYWIMDEQTLGLGETKKFGEIEARFAASLPVASLGSGEGADPYAPYVTMKEQKMVYHAGKAVYELVDADGNAYVLNAYGAQVKDADPQNLADQLQPADGWSFRSRVLDSEMVIVQKGDQPNKMVGDDLHQYYSLEAAD
ncbi:hypothetical protein SAMN05444007_106157 [Cribrihabitans marinus]|uniref:Protease inhibitor Inh n=1 Tax=Cribrihabitans marinus TaxID=1227549 RepID=A0A1H7B572_9RHOB|nr:hypothetical protein [Cribrihabitans marinus]GGH32439.1 hypothetical protein GCM10010973_23920 [Cribrihabitans marinus]SEJ68555.1 hypothetical protein SAMN05444007_106157 [Cribrihabitans marinus]